MGNFADNRHDDGASLVLTPSLVIWIIGSALTTLTVLNGQVGIFTALLTTGFWVSGRSSRWRRAGVWLGLACGLKIFLAPLGVWCLMSRERRQAVVPALLSCGATVLIGGLAYGFSAYPRWIANLGLVTWAWGGNNASLQGWMAKSFSASPYFVPVVRLPSSIVTSTATIISASVLLWVVWWSHRQDVDVAVSMISMASLWCSPIGWIYYGWIALPPMLILWRDGRLRAPLVYVGAACLWFPPWFYTAIPRPWWTLTFASSYFWGLTAFLLSVITARETRAISPAPKRPAK